MDVIINYPRPGIGSKRYVDVLVEDDRLRIKTINRCLDKLSGAHQQLSFGKALSVIMAHRDRGDLPAHFYGYGSCTTNA